MNFQRGIYPVDFKKHYLITLGLLLAAPSQADIILIPKNNRAQSFAIPYQHQDLFNASEQTLLNKNNKTFISKSILIKTNSEQTQNSIIHWYRKNAAPYFELELPALSSPQGFYDNYLWGRNNIGNTQKVAIDHYTSGKIEGVIGEDVFHGRYQDFTRLPKAPQETKVAVLDTGIDFNHPDLKNKIDSKGWNVISNNDQTQDTHGHGTHVSGIILSVTSNTKIIPIKVIQTGPNAPIRPQTLELAVDSHGALETALSQNVAKGILKAIDLKAQVINLSLAWPATLRSILVEEMIKLAYEKNVLVVASAGNDQTPAWVYPCAYSTVLCVGAHGADGSRSYFSNYGPMVDVLAPGSSILSTWPINKTPSSFAGAYGYEYRNGTSMAAPYVVGLLSELIGRGLTPQQAQLQLKANTRPTMVRSKYSSTIQGPFTESISHKEKLIRFGNVDFFNAFESKPKPLISLAQKIYSTQIISPQPQGSKTLFNLDLVNEGRNLEKASVQIQVLGKTYFFQKWNYGETKSLEIELFPHREAEEVIPIQVKVLDAQEVLQNETLYKTIRYKTLINENSTQRQSVSNVQIPHALDLSQYDFRVLHQLQTEYSLLVGESQVEVIKNKQYLGQIDLTPYTSETLLSTQLDPSGNLVFILTDPKSNPNRPTFILLRFNQNLKSLTPLKIESQVSAFNEKFKWQKMDDQYLPIWISVGLTPTADLPKKSPWKEDYKDFRAPRVYFLTNAESTFSVRALKLNENEVPLFFENENTIITVSGEGYDKKYTKIILNGDTLFTREPVQQEQYRMLVSATDDLSLFDAHGKKDELGLWGFSSLGNLRISNLLGTFDKILYRSSTLESLLQPLAAYTLKQDSSWGAWVQTQYDLKFLSGDQTSSTASIVTSLNRFSFIPNLLVNRSFFPIIATTQQDEPLPAVYIPASLVNENTAEVWIANQETAEIQKPKNLKVLPDQNCLMAPDLTSSGPNYQFKFICASQTHLQLLSIPIQAY